MGVFASGRGRQSVSLVSIIKWLSFLIESVRRGVELSKCYCPRQFPLVPPIPGLRHGDFNCEADHVVIAIGLGWAGIGRRAVELSIILVIKMYKQVSQVESRIYSMHRMYSMYSM